MLGFAKRYCSLVEEKSLSAPFPPSAAFGSLLGTPPPPDDTVVISGDAEGLRGGDPLWTQEQVLPRSGDALAGLEFVHSP